MEVERYKNSMNDYQRLEKKSDRGYLGLNLVQNVFSSGGLGVVLTLLLLNAQRNGAVGLATTVLVMMQYWSQLLLPLTQLGYSQKGLQSTLIDAQRVFEILSEAPSVLDRVGATDLDVPRVQGKIVFDHVDFGYNVGQSTLKDLSFTIMPGQTVALVGATGSGKTTVPRLIYRDYDPESGTIYLDDQDVRCFTQQSLRKCLGIVPQARILSNHLILGHRDLR